MPNRKQYQKDPEVNRLTGFQSVTGDNSQPNSLNYVSELQDREDYPKQIPILANAPSNLAQEKLTTPKKSRDDDFLDTSQGFRPPRRSLELQRPESKQETENMNDSGKFPKVNDNAAKKEQKKKEKRERREQTLQSKEKQKDTGAKSQRGEKETKKEVKENKQLESKPSPYTFYNLYSHLPVVEKRDIQTLLDNHKVAQIISGDTLVEVAKLGRLIAEDEIKNDLDRVRLMLNVLRIVLERYNDFNDNSETYLTGILHHLNTVIDFFSKCHILTIAQGNAVRGIKKIIQRLQLHVKNSNFSDSTSHTQKLNGERQTSLKNSYQLKNAFSYNTGDGDPRKETKNIIKQYIISYIEQKIIYSGSNIIQKAAEKIQQNDIVMIYGYQQNIIQVLRLANQQGKNITAVVVDGQPRMTGRIAIRELLASGIDCKYVYLSGLQMVVRQVTKIILQAEAVGSNGAVLGLSGTGQLAIQAHFNLIPVIFCSESCRFSEKKFLTPISYNKMLPYHKNQNAGETQNAESIYKEDFEMLDFMLDVTDPAIITTIITEEECYAPQTLSTIIQEQFDDLEF